MLDLLRFRLRMLLAALTVKPVRGGSPEGDDEGGKADENDGKTDDEGKAGGDDKADDHDDDDDGDDDGEEKGKRQEPDWKRLSRRNERNLKKAEQQVKDLQAKLDKSSESQKSERERELEQAKREAREEAEKTFDGQRRKDKLEVAVTRLAMKGVKVGEGDDAKTLKFADPEDALVHLERAISTGDVDGDDVFDGEGRPASAAITEALADLLERKPHLAAAGNGGAGGKSDDERKVRGSADGGKGGRASTKEPTVDEELAVIRRNK